MYPTIPHMTLSTIGPGRSHRKSSLRLALLPFPARRGTEALRPVLLHDLIGARDRQGVGGNVLGDGRARADVGPPPRAPAGQEPGVAAGLGARLRHRANR